MSTLLTSVCVPDFPIISLERVADGEVEGLVAVEAVEVEESALLGLVRHVQTDTPVESEDEEIEVVAYSHARSHGHLVEDALELELGVDQEVVEFIVVKLQLVDVPHVSGIEEEGSMEVAEESLAVFEVSQKLHVAVLEEVGCLRIVESGEVAGAYAADGECSHAVGASHIEQLAEGCCLGVGIGIDHSAAQMAHEGGVGGECPRLGEVGLHLDELGIGVLEHLLATLVPLASEGHIAER